MANKGQSPDLGNLLSSPQAAELLKNKKALEGLMHSAEGQKLMQMVGGDGKSDPASVVTRLNALMQTPEGAQLIGRLKNNLPK